MCFAARRCAPTRCRSWTSPFRPGVHDGAAAVKALLAGAAAVQVCTAIHRHGYEVIGTINRFIDEWAARQGFDSLEEFCGRMDYGSSEGEFYQRVQYMKYFPHGEE